MSSKLFTVFIFCAGFAACSASKTAYQYYLEPGTDTLYLNDEIAETRRTYTMSYFGYQTFSFNRHEGNINENVKLDGLILPARSEIQQPDYMWLIFGSAADTCVMNFTKTCNQTRRGRSALISVLNLVSTFQGEKTQKQDEPDTTLSSVVFDGRMNIKDLSSLFYCKRNYKREYGYEGWLLLNGDTLHAIQVKALRRNDEDRHGTGGEFDHWLQLEKNGTVYGAIRVNPVYRSRVYVLKQLAESSRMMIAAYLSVIVRNA